MILVKWMFAILPYVAFIATLWAFVYRKDQGRTARIVWTAWLLFCCSKFLCFATLGGEAFYPELPELLVWFWNWAYSGAVILCALSFVWWHRSRRWLLPLVAWSLSAWGLWNGISLPPVVERTFFFDDLPAELDGYRIVHLTDIHTSSAARRWRTEGLVHAANALDADLICLTGDNVDGRVEQRLPDVEPLRDLRARDGVYLVTGNHEYYFGWPAWKAAYERLGLRFLVNECVFPRKSLALGGVNDYAAYNVKTGEVLDEQPDVRLAFAAATNGEFRVLLQHQPKFARDNLRAFGVRLQLSGHTHGGIMPILASVVESYNKGFLRGLYETEGGQVFVHPGSGQWAGFPVRFFDPAEITLITLRRTRQ